MKMPLGFASVLVVSMVSPSPEAHAGQFVFVDGGLGTLMLSNDDGTGLQCLMGPAAQNCQIVETLSFPGELAVSLDGQFAFLTDKFSSKIYRVDFATMTAVCIVSQSGNCSFTDVGLISPWGVAISEQSQEIYVADLDTATVRRYNFDGSSAGTPISDGLVIPIDVVVDPTTESLYILDGANGHPTAQMHRLTLAGTPISTVGIDGTPQAIVLNATGGTIRWVDIDADGNGDPSDGRIMDIDLNLDATSIMPVKENVAAPNNLAITSDGMNMIWTAFYNFQFVSVRRSDIEGNNEVELYSPPLVDIPSGVARLGVATEPIPTVSDWGMVAMILLLLTAGTVVFRYRFYHPQCHVEA